MNKIEATIRPEKLNNVTNPLAEVGLVGLNVVHVTGRGTQRGVTMGGAAARADMWLICCPRLSWSWWSTTRTHRRL